MALSAFFSKLKTGLSRSTEKLSGNIAATFTKRKLDDEALEELEDMLIGADLGPAVAAKLIENFRKTRFGKEVTDQEIRIGEEAFMMKMITLYPGLHSYRILEP